MTWRAQARKFGKCILSYLAFWGHVRTGWTAGWLETSAEERREKGDQEGGGKKRVLCCILFSSNAPRGGSRNMWLVLLLDGL